MVATPITAEEYEEMQQIAREHCKHSSAAQVNTSVFVAAADGSLTRIRVMKQRQCTACGAWLSLGHSSDEYETADDEITLGEMIADVHCRLEGSEAEALDAFVDFHVECAVDFDALLNTPAPEGAA